MKNLGVIFDENFSFNDHINQLSRKSHYQLIKVKNIKKYMDKTTLEMVIHSLIFSNIDYCNAIFHSLPEYQLHKIQRIQNYAARILTNTGKFSHITPVLKELHWLPVKYRIKFKILITTFKCLHDRQGP